MSKRYKFIALSIVILAYAFMQIATRKDVCNSDCQAIGSIFVDLDKTYPDAVYSVQRCSLGTSSDSICVYVNSAVVTNWNQVAERTCTLATANGLLQQKVYILANTTNIMVTDTLARLQCP
jgi:hypothetical protein